MHAQEKMSLAAIAIGASICDRKLDDKERHVVNGILNDLKLSEEERGLVYRKVFFSPLSTASLISEISGDISRKKARELARRVCEADGTLRAEELSFLKMLEEEDKSPALDAVIEPIAHRAEYIIQHFARVSEAIRNRSPVAGTVFLTSVRMQLILKMRHCYRAAKRAEIAEVRMILRLTALSLAMRPYALAIAHSDGAFHGQGYELPETQNEGFMDYLVTYGLGCLLQEYYENPQAVSTQELRGVYIAAMLRGRFARASQTVPGIARHRYKQVS